MWLFTIFGFFSVVSAGDEKVQIRARNPEHLRNLKSKCPALSGYRIQLDETGKADYYARLIVPLLKWQIVAGYLADEAAKQTNFKDDLRRGPAGDDRELLAWATETWKRGSYYQQAYRSASRKKKFSEDDNANDSSNGDD